MKMERRKAETELQDDRRREYGTKKHSKDKTKNRKKTKKMKRRKVE